MDENNLKSDQAFQLVGEFMFLWGALEHWITTGIKNLLNLETVQANIVFANVAFRDKTSILSTLAELTLRQSAPAKADDARKLLQDIIDFSGTYRNVLVHNPFFPNGKDGIELFRVKAKRKYEVPKTVWDREFFQARFREMQDFSLGIENLTADLSHHDAVKRIAQAMLAPKSNIPPLSQLGLLNLPPQGNTNSRPSPSNQEKSPQTPDNH
jgi:hypothetical protein